MKLLLLLALLALSSCASLDNCTQNPPEADIKSCQARKDARLVREVLEDNISQFKKCYQDDLDRTKIESEIFEGVVILDFVVEQDGNIKSTNVTSKDSTPSNLFSSCLVESLKSLQFLPTISGETIGIKQAFSFKRNSRSHEEKFND